MEGEKGAGDMRYHLAPLAGFTDAPFRRLCFEGGADMCYSEMVSAAGLAHGSNPTLHLLETMPEEGPVSLQLFGAKPDEMAIAAKIVSAHEGAVKFAELNLNAGCPMTKVTKCGAGAKLVEDPGLVYELLCAMRENTSLPVTLKTRLGPRPDRIRIFELVESAERAGAEGIIVHARFTSEMHGGNTHLDLLKEVKERTKIAVTGNGGVTDQKSAADMEETNVDAVMIGRAALSNPAIFNVLKGKESTRDFVRTHLRYLMEYRDLLAKKYPLDHIPSVDGFASVKMHTHLFRYFNGRPGAAKLRQKLNSVRTIAEIYDIIYEYG